MKVILGLDNLDRVKSIGKTLRSFQFPNVHVELVHVLGRLMETPLQSIDVVPKDAVKKFLKMQEDEARSLLTTAATEIKNLELETDTKLLTGASGNRIIEYANENKADLLVLGPSGKGLYERMMIGSVSRKALTSAHTSLLLVKKELDPTRPLTVVMATDHSPYSKRCLKRFASWKPLNVKRVVLTTIFPEQLIGALGSVMENFKGDVAHWVRKELENSNNHLAEDLHWKNIEIKTRVDSGDVSDTLERVMKEENADILVLGAQGKGFQERMTIGSVSLEQGISKPYNIMIIREH